MTTTRTEYRVVGIGREGVERAGVFQSLSHAQARAEALAKDTQFTRAWKNIRIQQRKITETPWTDVEGEG